MGRSSGGANPGSSDRIALCFGFDRTLSEGTL